MIFYRDAFYYVTLVRNQNTLLLIVRSVETHGPSSYAVAPDDSNETHQICEARDQKPSISFVRSYKPSPFMS